MDLAPVRAQVAADIAAATSLAVSLDPKKAQAPCVLVGPITEVEVGGPCAWSVTLPVWIIAPAPGDQRAVDYLAERVTDVMDVLPEVSSATLGAYNVGQGDLPAYEITTTVVAKE